LSKLETHEQCVHADLRSTTFVISREDGAAEVLGQLSTMRTTMAAKSYGTVSAELKNQMTGLEFVQGVASGARPLTTIAQTLGYDVVEAEKGRVVITLMPNVALLKPAGGVHG